MKLKKFVAAAVSCAVVAGAIAGCTIGGDTSWCAKSSNTTMPTGVYIYELYQAYTEASSKADSSDLKNAKVENEAAFTWIANRAKELTNELFVLDDKMKEKNLSFTSDEQDTIKQTAANAWVQQYKSLLESKGVAQSSFQKAYAERSYALQKVFSATYDHGGEKAVPEADMRKYFEAHYADFAYTSVNLTKTDSDGNSTAMSDSEKAAVKKELDGYLGQIQAGKTTVKDASAAYAKAHNTDDAYQEATQDLDSEMASYYLPSDMITAIKGMKNGETRLLEISGTYYVLVTKNDITKKTDSFLKDDSNRTSLLYEQYGDEFTKSIEDEAKKYNKATWNDKVLQKYTADLFYEKPSSTSSTGPVTASSSASGTSSAASAASSSASGTSSTASAASSSASGTSSTASAASSSASSTSSAASAASSSASSTSSAA